MKTVAVIALVLCLSMLAWDFVKPYVLVFLKKLIDRKITKIENFGNTAEMLKRMNNFLEPKTVNSLVLISDVRHWITNERELLQTKIEMELESRFYYKLIKYLDPFYSCESDSRLLKTRLVLEVHDNLFSLLASRYACEGQS